MAFDEIQGILTFLKNNYMWGRFRPTLTLTNSNPSFLGILLFLVLIKYVSQAFPEKTVEGSKVSSLWLLASTVSTCSIMIGGPCEE